MGGISGIAQKVRDYFRRENEADKAHIREQMKKDPSVAKFAQMAWADERSTNDALAAVAKSYTSLKKVFTTGVGAAAGFKAGTDAAKVAAEKAAQESLSRMATKKAVEGIAAKAAVKGAGLFGAISLGGDVVVFSTEKYKAFNQYYNSPQNPYAPQPTRTPSLAQINASTPAQPTQTPSPAQINASTPTQPTQTPSLAQINASTPAPSPTRTPSLAQINESTPSQAPSGSARSRGGHESET
ncbi:MAG TPA: hypothetical protein VGK74_07275 [Symbiobacteriaceae bacterium]